MRDNSIVFLAFACFVLGAMFMAGSIRSDRAEANITAQIVSDNFTQCEPRIIYINTTKIIEVEKVPDWLQYLRDFAATHEYHETDYNCNDFSRDSVAGLRDMRVMARQVIGKCNYTSDPSSLHAWDEVSFWIEPQTGKFIPVGACYENA